MSGFHEILTQTKKQSNPSISNGKSGVERDRHLGNGERKVKSQKAKVKKDTSTTFI